MTPPQLPTDREPQPALWQPGLPGAPGTYWLHARLHASLPGTDVTPPAHLHLLHVTAAPDQALLHRTGDRVITSANVTDATHTPATLPLLPGDPRNPQHPESPPQDTDPTGRDAITVVYRLHVIDQGRLHRVYRRYCQAFPNWAGADFTSDKDIATELISNLELVTQARAADVTTWADLGLSY